MKSQVFSLLSIAVVALLVLLLRSASREAAAEGERRILRYSGAWKGLVWAMWAFPLVIAVVMLVSPPKPEEWWIPFAIIGGFSAIHAPLTLEVLKRRVELTGETITGTSAWGRPVTIAWRELAAVSWRPSAGDLLIQSRAGAKVRVSMWLSGLGTLADSLERNAPALPSVRECAQTLRSLKR